MVTSDKTPTILALNLLLTVTKTDSVTIAVLPEVTKIASTEMVLHLAEPTPNVKHLLVSVSILSVSTTSTVPNQLSPKVTDKVTTAVMTDNVTIVELLVASTNTVMVLETSSEELVLLTKQAVINQLVSALTTVPLMLIVLMHVNLTVKLTVDVASNVPMMPNVLSLEPLMFMMESLTLTEDS